MTSTSLIFLGVLKAGNLNSSSHFSFKGKRKGYNKWKFFLKEKQTKCCKAFSCCFIVILCLVHQYHNHIHSYNNQITQYIQTLSQVNIITHVLCSQESKSHNNSIITIYLWNLHVYFYIRNKIISSLQNKNM